jgi:hypothetical protein
VRYLRNLVLLTAAALAISAMATTSASAIVSPNGDQELDNWKSLVSVKGYRLSADGTTATWELCPGLPATTAGGPGNSKCRTTVNESSSEGEGNFWWHFKGVDVLDPVCTTEMKLHFGSTGKTLIYDAEWWAGGFDFCRQWFEPASYASDPSLQANVSGQICKHVPSGTFWLRQGIVLNATWPGVADLIWNPTFAAINGYPYHFSPTNTYPYGIGLQTDTMSVGTPTQYQEQDGSPSDGSGKRQHIPPVKIANLLLTPAATACPWPGLT